MMAAVIDPCDASRYDTFHRSTFTRFPGIYLILEMTLLEDPAQVACNGLLFQIRIRAVS